AAVSRLCTRCVHLSRGRAIATGSASSVVEGYLTETSSTQSQWLRPSDQRADRKIEFLSARICGENGQAVAVLNYPDPIRVELQCRENQTHTLWFVRVSVYDSKGNEILCSWDNE